MKKITFQQIIIKNFLSVGEEPVIVDFKEGIHLITGSNKDKPDRQNGVGKSTIADAIYFAVFGDTLRELKKELIVNNITGGKTHVELKFRVETGKETTEFHVIRTLSPTKVLLFENGEDKTRDSIPNTTKYICDVLSASPSIFQNCVIMTVNNAVPFMSKNKVEKRKFIEDIFGLEVFSKMVSLVRQEYLDVKKKIDIKQVVFDEATRTYNNYKEQQEKITQRKQEKRELYLTRQSTNKAEIEEIVNLIEKSQPSEDIGKIRKILQALDSKLTTTDKDIHSKLEEITKLKTQLIHKNDIHKKIGTKEEKCPVCLRNITEHDIKLVEKEKELISDQIKQIANEITQCTSDLDVLKLTKEKIKKAIQQKNNQVNDVSIKQTNIANLEKRKHQLEEWLIELDKDIKELDNNNDGFQSLIEKSQSELKTIEDEISNINNELNKLDIVKYVVSEEGVKSYIVNKLLELLNSKLFYYLKKLDSNSVCVFNEFFEEEIVNERGKVCSYFNFSGAERKAIDLACLFAFSDIRRLQGGVSYNIAIYDELFDSSFDSKGIELITDILQERVETYNECAIVISHRKESLKSVTGEVIYLEKENGITKRVNYID